MRRISFRHHPCLTCGACCAAFRVSFYWREADDTPEGTVPLALTEDINSLRRCMRGTNQPQPHCIALEGTIGESVRCAMYRDRPSVCREAGVQRAGGRWTVTPEELERCNKARAMHGLPPLETQIKPRKPRRVRHTRRHWPRSA